MIDALIGGKISGTPSQRTGRNGSKFTLAKVRVPSEDGTVFCNVIAFDNEVQVALLALGDGDAVSIAGSIKVGTWTAKDGKAHPSIDMTASGILSVYHVAKRRKAARPDRDGAAAPQERNSDPSGQWNGNDGLDDGECLDF